MMLAKDMSITVRQALARVPITRAFYESFFFPLLARWCIEPEEFIELAAYDVFRYHCASLSIRGSVRFQEIVGGTRVYVEALIKQLPHATRRQGVTIAGIEQRSDAFVVRERDGRAHTFNQLVLATSASEAAALLRDIPSAAKARGLLERIRCFKTKIAVHGDRRVMPPRERDWSIVNMRDDGTHAQSTMWKPGRGDLFRSWVTFDGKSSVGQAYR